MGYVFRGTNRDIDELPTLELAPGGCGTNAGYRLHMGLRTPTCQPCRDAHAAYQRAWERRPRMRNVCGTYAGYMRHKRAEGDACEFCLRAYAEYMSSYRANRKLVA